MALEDGQTYAAFAAKKLKEAGLPEDPRNVIGRTYQFGCQFDSHHCALYGTVLSVDINEEGDTVMSVSNPRIWGHELKDLRFFHGAWNVRFKSLSDTDCQHMKGELQLL